MQNVQKEKEISININVSDTGVANYTVRNQIAVFSTAGSERRCNVKR